MICRCCGHDNKGRDEGKCENCGFDLSRQNLGMKDQREGLQNKLDKKIKIKERSEFKPPPSRGSKPAIGILIALVGLAAAFVITQSFERAEYTPELPQREEFMQPEEETPQDSIAMLIQSDIVYVLNDSATRALPRANVDMTAIPEGATVSFLGGWSVPLRPAATFIVQKLSQREFRVLDIDRICVWTDTTETDFISAPLVRLQQAEGDSIPGSVLVKLYFTPEMMRGRVEEYSIQYDKAITTGEFTDTQLKDLVTTVYERLERKDYAERDVQIAVLFDYNAYDLGDAVDIMNRIAPLAIDSLEYQGFSVSVFALN